MKKQIVIICSVIVIAIVNIWNININTPNDLSLNTLTISKARATSENNGGQGTCQQVSHTERYIYGNEVDIVTTKDCWLGSFTACEKGTQITTVNYYTGGSEITGGFTPQSCVE